MQGTKYQVLPDFEICCSELGGFKVTIFCACMFSFCSVVGVIIRKESQEQLARHASMFLEGPSCRKSLRVGDESRVDY